MILPIRICFVEELGPGRGPGRGGPGTEVPDREGPGRESPGKGGPWSL